MQKAIFLDRDGVLIRERGDYNYKEEHIEPLEGIIEALQLLSRAGYLLIVITNQSGIAKGVYTHKRVKEIHAQLKDFFGGYGIKITEFYYCPHHPDHSHCLCRKPDSLMLEKAIARFNIDPASSWFIGDTERDIIAGKKAGVHTLHIQANARLGDYLPQILVKEA